MAYAASVTTRASRISSSSAPRRVRGTTVTGPAVLISAARSGGCGGGRGGGGRGGRCRRACGAGRRLPGRARLRAGGGGRFAGGAPLRRLRQRGHRLPC